MNRRFFIGDLHGCLDELNDLLAEFQFEPGKDQLFSVGDVIGKGPHPVETIKKLKSLNAGIVRGNHDEAAVRSRSLNRENRSLKQQSYLDELNPDFEKWVNEIETWPFYLELDDILLVHGGIIPNTALKNIPPRILMKIRTWDGKGENLNEDNNPPWYECVQSDKIIVFGHWAKKGLVDLPRFKGLDTGCVYGRRLTGYCPEENRFYSVQSRKVYAPVKGY